MMDLRWWIEVLNGSARSMIMVVEIVIPLMVAIEFLKLWDIINKVSPVFKPILKALRLPGDALFPLVAGLLFGMTYGAGIIIQSAREGAVTKRDLFTVLLFLVICHSLIEDTMLFVAVGANFWVIVVSRLVMAFLITFAWVRISEKFRQPEEIRLPE